MKPITTIYRLSLALLLAASVSACGTDSSSSGGSSASGGDGFSLRVTDAPAAFIDIERLYLTFREVHLRKAEGGWLVIPTGELVNTTIEIAGLQGTKTADLLANLDVPEGDYTELRLIVEDPGSIDLTTGGTEPLEIPSGSTSGLKIKGDFMVVEGQPTVLVIDFDLLRSIFKTGGPSPKYKMKPVLRLIKGNEFGHARGVVDGNLLTAPGCSVGEHNAVYVFEGHGVTPNDITNRNNDVDPFTTSRITMDSTGVFVYEAAFLPAGEYTIAFTCNADDEDPKKDDDLKFFGEMDITIKVNDTQFL